MPRWKPLSAELDPRARQLIVHLRRLKDRSGLSTRQLAAKTGYSAKSWERYLGGRSLPPVEAVEALARIGGVDAVRLLALREVAAGGGQPSADAVPAGPAAVPDVLPAAVPPAVPPPDALDSPAHRRLLRLAVVSGVAALVVAVSSAVFVALRLDTRGEVAVTPVAAPGSASSSAPPAYTCRTERTGGLWYAGISRTRDAELGYGDAGPEVAEAQCLLRRAGISPGGIDGMFGPLTQRAVKAFQKRSGLDVDGMVGPHTWKALRG
ncbi:peptidoglycan-binding protein [Streptomyces sp. NPDC090306]|uniref:peptidoglycan-binding protein n=1 Tax=unclassified Streptomyces TaxID=2593676 RepID=UPI0036E697F9